MGKNRKHCGYHKQRRFKLHLCIDWSRDSFHRRLKFSLETFHCLFSVFAKHLQKWVGFFFPKSWAAWLHTVLLYRWEIKPAGYSLISAVCVSRKAVDEAGREVWLYNGTYWRLRKEPGFSNTQNLDLYWSWCPHDEWWFMYLYYVFCIFVGFECFYKCYWSVSFFMTGVWKEGIGCGGVIIIVLGYINNNDHDGAVLLPFWVGLNI